MIKETFDNVISLGFNCQTAFAIQAFYYGNKKTTSCFFNWVFCHGVSCIIDFLKNPELLGTKGLEFSTDSFMYKDLALNMSYHVTSAHDNFFNNGELNNDFVEENKNEVISRMTYLKDKFFNLVQSDSKNLFILTYPTFEDKSKFQENIKTFSELIYKLSGNKNSKILFVIEKGYIKNKKLPKFDNVIYKYTKFHSKISSANCIDFLSWYKIFKSFYIKNMPKINLINVIKFKISQKITIYDNIKKWIQKF